MKNKEKAKIIELITYIISIIFICILLIGFVVGIILKDFEMVVTFGLSLSTLVSSIILISIFINGIIEWVNKRRKYADRNV